jgi:hypothetical protein
VQTRLRYLEWERRSETGFGMVINPFPAARLPLANRRPGGPVALCAGASRTDQA